MYTPPTFRTSLSATSSPASAAGPSRFVAPAGQTIDLFGLVPVRANLSARQAKELGLLTSGTYGQRSTTSSASAALQQSLENRLRAKTQILGSTLYKMTWKAWDTGSGRSRFRLRASVLRTSETDSTGRPTPAARDWKSASASPEFLAGRLDEARGKPLSEQVFACLAGWPTPVTGNAMGSQSFEGLSATGRTPDGRKVAVSLNHVARMTDLSGQTPTGPNGIPTTDLAHGGSTKTPARLTATGELLTGSDAGMPSGGQLRPGHSRWLMGYPVAWDLAAPNWSDWHAWQDLITQV